MKILLVIDVQEKYLSYYDADLLSRINARIYAAQTDNTPIYYVRNIGSQGNNDSYALARNLLIVSEHIYEKKFPSAFTNISFAKELNSLEVSDIVVLISSCHLVSTSSKPLTISLPLTTAYTSSLGAASMLCLLILHGEIQK